MGKKVILSGNTELLKPVITEILALQQVLEDIGGPTFQVRGEATVKRKYKPKVILYFVENSNDVDPEYGPITAEPSFRLMDESTDSMTAEKATVLAKKIKSKFLEPLYVWKKGKEMCSYTHWDLGYQLQLLCRNKLEGKRLVEQILDLQGHSPEWDYFNHEVNEAPLSRYPTIPEKKTILGQSVKTLRQRPIGDVEFRYAVLNLWGLRTPIALVDRFNKLKDPLIEP